MPRVPSNTLVPDVPLVAVPSALKQSCSLAVACIPALRAAFDGMTPEFQARFLAVLKGEPTLGILPDADADAAFAALENGFTRHAVALLNLVNFIDAVP